MWLLEDFAHGYEVLEKIAGLLYKTDYCAPEHECGITWNDPAINIQWSIQK